MNFHIHMPMLWNKNHANSSYFEQRLDTLKGQLGSVIRTFKYDTTNHQCSRNSKIAKGQSLRSKKIGVTPSMLQHFIA